MRDNTTRGQGFSVDLEETDSFSDQDSEYNHSEDGKQALGTRSLTVFKTRAKLWGVFFLLLVGVGYTNWMILSQNKTSNRSIESQSRIMANQTVLSDAISCFGAIKYWFAILDNGLKKNPVELPDESAERGVRCDLEKFGAHLRSLESFSGDRDVEDKYMAMRNLPKDAMTAYIAGDAATGKEVMIKAYNKISEVDEGLSAIAKKINQTSAELSARAFEESEKFRKFPVKFLVFSLLGISLVWIIIYYNIFQPMANIITTMIDASRDPHNTKDYIIHHDAGRKDEMGAVISALNSLLLQVHEGFRRTEEAEQESADAARQLDAIFNSVADGLITVNAEGDIISLNKSAYGIFGYDRQSVRDKNISDFFPPDMAMTYMRGIQHFVSTGSSDLVDSGPKEMRGLKAGGGEIPIELSVTSVQRDDGHSVFFVNSIRDIAYRKDLERQLLQAQKMEALGSLSSGIAHEINTPTQYVRDNIKFLQDAFQAYDGFYKGVNEVKDALPEDQAAVRGRIEELETKQDLGFFSGEVPQALEQSLEGAGRISEIVGAIKGFSYPATEDIVYVDLNEALKNTVIVSRNQWKPYAQVKMEFDENLPPVPCIPGKLTQVILNLIVNATHAIEEKSAGNGDPDNNVITITTSATKKKATIKVSDTGCGIPKENMTKIFNPFFTTKEVGKGTGQGLSISYDIIVKKHGGALTVESEPGKGATFIIDLPMEVENAKASSKKKTG